MNLKFVNGGTYNVTGMTAEQRTMIRDALQSEAAAKGRMAMAAHQAGQEDFAKMYAQNASDLNKLARNFSI